MFIFNIAKTKKQKIVSWSSCEAEYSSLAATECELLWINYTLKDLKVKDEYPCHIMVWQQSSTTYHRKSHIPRKNKHLDIDCHLVCDQYKLGFLLPKHISTKQQLAYLFTKALCGPVFQTLFSKLNLQDRHPLRSMLRGEC